MYMYSMSHKRCVKNKQHAALTATLEEQATCCSYCHIAQSTDENYNSAIIN